MSDMYDEGDFYREDDGGSKEIECRFIQIARETKAAYLITFEIGEDMRPVQAWLPKSQVTISNTTNSIYIPRWLVTDKELEAYEL